MKQIVIISGKGGTGKTVVTAALAALADRKVMVDCDVDAADLHLLLHPAVAKRYEFKSGHTAVINKKLCNNCGGCIAICRFQAIKDDCTIDRFSCEGCGLCSRICPRQAITMQENTAGEWYISDTKYGPLVHARLGTAEENSGKLVAKIKQASKELAKSQNLGYVIVDGPPGIGCPVIASLSGTDCAVVVTEPTLSGMHDASRAIEVAGYFNIPAKLIINKHDLNQEVSGQIERFCQDKGLAVIGKIPFDEAVVKSLVAGTTIVEYGPNPAADELRKIWDALK